MDQLGIGVIGVGMMGSLFARLATQLPDVRLVAVADADGDRATECGRVLGVPALVDYRDLLMLPGVDAVVIATPDTQHLAPAVAAAQAGKHMMLEKPLATSGEDGLCIAEAAAAANVILMVAHVLRFDPHYGEARKAIKAGKLGELVHISSRRTTSLSDAMRLQGRVTVTYYLGSHEVDMLQWVVGSPIVEVTSIGVSKVLRQFAVDDTVLSLLRFADGAIGSLETSFIRPSATAARRIGASLLVMGSEAAFKVEPVSDNATLYAADRSLLAVPGYGFESTEFGCVTGVYRDEMAHFVRCVRMGIAPIITAGQALATIRVCDAIEESLRTGRPARIEHDDVYAY